MFKHKNLLKYFTNFKIIRYEYNYCWFVAL